MKPKKCPKDADRDIFFIDDKNNCQHKISYDGDRKVRVENLAWCTRPKGHKGAHHEHGQHPKYRCWRMWTTEEEIIEAL